MSQDTLKSNVDCAFVKKTLVFIDTKIGVAPDFGLPDRGCRRSLEVWTPPPHPCSLDRCPLLRSTDEDHSAALTKVGFDLCPLDTTEKRKVGSR